MCLKKLFSEYFVSVVETQKNCVNFHVVTSGHILNVASAMVVK